MSNPTEVASPRATSKPEEIVRAFLLTYVVDRVGRPASVTARAAAHDALDALEAMRKAAV